MADGIFRGVRVRFLQEIEQLLPQCLFAWNPPKLRGKPIPMSDSTFEVNANDRSLYLIEEERLEGACWLRSYLALDHPVFCPLSHLEE